MPVKNAALPKKSANQGNASKVSPNNQLGKVRPMVKQLQNNEIIKKKPIKNNPLLEFIDIDQTKKNDMINLNLKTLRDLYMLEIEDRISLLSLIQTKNDEIFDKENYTHLMYKISKNLYSLPLDSKEFSSGKIDANSADASESLSDELFMWSILTFSGRIGDTELLYHYWSLTSKPISCALAAMVVYERFLEFFFVSDQLKDLINEQKIKFEEWATGTLRSCVLNGEFEAQDLILSESKFFRGHTALELANKAAAEQFLSSIAVQQLLTDIWHGKINPYLSSFRIIICIFFWPFIYVLKIFKYDFEQVSKEEKIEKNKNNSDEDRLMTRVETPKKKHMQQKVEFHTKDLPFRVNGEENSVLRIYYFLNAPIIKYVHHTVLHLLFLGIFLYLILFDYVPMPTAIEGGNYVSKKLFGLINITWLKMPLTEAFIIFYLVMDLVGEIRKIFTTKTFDSNFIRRQLSKLEEYLKKDYWNMFQLIFLVTFFTGLGFRNYPTTSSICFSSGEDCSAVGKVFYCAALTMAGVKTIRYMNSMQTFGPKYQIILEMIRKLTVFAILMLVFMIPYAFSFEAILVRETQQFSLKKILKALYAMMWTLLLEIETKVEEVQSFPCVGYVNDTCVYTLSSTFLYVTLPIYVCIENILLLNLVIAVFTGIVMEMTKKATNSFYVMRYANISDWTDKTIIPPPFNIIEFVFRFIMAIIKLFIRLIGQSSVDNSDFALKHTETENELNRFEVEQKEIFLAEERKNEAKKSDIVGKRLKLMEQKLNFLYDFYQHKINQNDKKAKVEALTTSIDFLHNIIMNSSLNPNLKKSRSVTSESVKQKSF